MRGEVFAFGPIPGAAEQGPTRSRIGTSIHGAVADFRETSMIAWSLIR